MVTPSGRERPENISRIAPMNRGGRTMIRHGWHLFPLTPALSPGERENCRQSQSYSMIPAAGGATVHGERGNHRQTSGNCDDSCHRMAHGSWAVACSDGNCSRTMNRRRSQSLREEDTSALTPALYCENAFGRKNYARAEALATPGEGTRPTGVRAYHSRW
jgi:hypothetical protein